MQIFATVKTVFLVFANFVQQLYGIMEKFHRTQFNCLFIEGKSFTVGDISSSSFLSRSLELSCQFLDCFIFVVIFLLKLLVQCRQSIYLFLHACIVFFMPSIVSSFALSCSCIKLFCWTTISKNCPAQDGLSGVYLRFEMMVVVICARIMHTSKHEVYVQYAHSMGSVWFGFFRRLYVYRCWF